MAQTQTLPSAEAIAKAAQAAGAEQGGAPVHLWNPPFCGDIDIRIARNGIWFYMGTPIGRPALVRLFSSILKKENDQYFLVTPVEKVGIQVEDVPFLAVDYDVEGSGQTQNITFITQTQDRTTAGKDTPIRIETVLETGEPSPYVTVRNNLEALIDRKSFYRLVDLCSISSVNGVACHGVWSGGHFFPISPVAAET